MSHQQLKTDDQAVKQAKYSLYTLGTTHFINDLMTTGIVPALLPLYKAAFHLSYTQAGLILLISALTSSVSQPIFGTLTDRKPRAWFLPVGLFLTGLGLALSGFMPSFPLLLLVIAISGLGSGIFHPEASRGAHLAAGKAKGTAQAIFQVGGNFGQAVGPLMLPLFILATGLKGLGIFILLGIVGSFLIYQRLPWYKKSLAAYHKRKKVVQGKRYLPGLFALTIVVVLRSWTQIGVAGFLPFFYLHQHIPLRISNLYTFLFLAAGALGTFLGGRFSDRVSHKWLLFFSMLITIPFSWILPHVHGWIAILVLLLFGFFVLSSFAVTVVYGQRMLPDKVGLVSGLMIGLGIGAGGIGATLMGWVSDTYGLKVVFDLFVFLPAIAAVITLFLPGERKLRN